MGIFYTNITLYGVDQPTVANYLRQQKRDAYVSPMQSGCTVIFDKESDLHIEALCSLATELSTTFHCAAFAVNIHDGDVFYYYLYQSGQLIDDYDSVPSYFFNEEPQAPIGGDAQKLCEAFHRPEAVAEVIDIFDRARQTVMDDDYSEAHLSGDEIHDVLAQALNLPLFAVDTGYHSITNGFLPDDLAKESLVLCVN
jgi:hypothetical protein